MIKIDRSNTPHEKSELNNLGEEGWELCHFNEKDKNGIATGIFKRIKVEELKS